MALKHRPSEVKAVVELLEQDHDDIEELAQKILDRLMEVKWNRGPWVAIQRHRKGSWFTAFGPYPTRTQAERDLGRRIIGAEPGDVAYFARVWDLDATQGTDPEVWDEQDQ